jgi:hypothetical protein
MDQQMPRSCLVTDARHGVAVAPGLRVNTHRYELNGRVLLGFERNVDYQMSEDLKQAGGNEALEMAVPVVASLDAPAHVYDLRQGKYLGKLQRIELTLDPWHPALFALTDKPLPDGSPVEALSSVNGTDARPSRR